MTDLTYLKELTKKLNKEPSKNPGYEEYNLELAEWRGEVTAKLDMMNEDIREIRDDVKEIKKHNSKRDIRTAGIAGSLSIIIVVFGIIIQNIIG